MSNSKYLIITEITNNSKKKKTKNFIIENKMNGSFLGWINWYPPFRKYAFTPSGSNIVFDAKCLKDITEKLEILMSDKLVEG